MDPDRVEQLRNPSCYPGEPDEVEIIQTHLSVVCLAGDDVYKLKKSIELPFADFTTLEKRKHFCEEELRLNRRLCPDTYREVVALRRGGEGGIRFSGKGEIIDYALKMKRLPADRMLDQVLRRDEVKADEIREIARTMSAFHERAERGSEIEEAGDPGKLRDFALANFEETADVAGSVFTKSLHRALAERTRRDFERWLPLLERRGAEGRIVDGHGDLHARNICLTEPVAIYDCIEFEPAFRCGDVATDHAFLVMDLRFRGHPELAQHYLDTVVEESGDGEMRDVMPLLVRYRALVRAKVASIAAGEDELDESQREAAARDAARYLRLAGASALEEEGPWWLLLCGLPGTGKSTLAAALAEAGGWPVLSSDRTRKELAGVGAGETLPEPCYSEEFSRRTYAEVGRRASERTPGAGVIVLDANFRKREQREAMAGAAAGAGARLAICELRLDEEEVKERLRRRAQEDGSISDASWEVYRKVRDSFQPVERSEADRVVTLTGGAASGSQADELLAGLLGAGSGS